MTPPRGRHTRQSAAVCHRMVPDSRLRDIHPILPVAALRARLQAVGFDLDRLAMDAIQCSFHIGGENIDGVIHWPDGTSWRPRL